MGSNTSKSHWRKEEDCLESEEVTSGDVFDAIVLEHFVFHLSPSPPPSSSSFSEVNGTLKANENQTRNSVFYINRLENKDTTVHLPII